MTRFVAQQLSTDHWYDISAAEREFGFVPEISIEEGLAVWLRFKTTGDSLPTVSAVGWSGEHLPQLIVLMLSMVLPSSALGKDAPSWSNGPDGSH